MILPHPESNFALNILVLGAEVIRQLQAESVVIEKLLQDFLKADRKRTPEMFFDALTLLYTIGVVRNEGYKLRVVSEKKDGV